VAEGHFTGSGPINSVLGLGFEPQAIVSLDLKCLITEIVSMHNCPRDLLFLVFSKQSA
jgi:hypothetical protein